MGTQYYYTKNNVTYGPFSFENLKTTGINENTLVWHDKLTEWQEAKNLPELKALFVKLPPPPPKQNTPPPVPPKSKVTLPFEKNINTNATAKKTNNTARNVFLGIIGVLAFIVIAIYLIDRLTDKDLTTTEQDPLVSAVQENTDATVDLIKQKQNQQEQAQAQALHDLTLHNRELRNNWRNYIKYEPNYNTDDFGGISKGYIYVTNNTEYPIDEISFNVSYIKKNGDEYKSEFITGRVGARAFEKIYFPNSDRGTKVKVQIIQIISTKMNFDFHLHGSGEPSDPNDPYFHKY